MKLVKPKKRSLVATLSVLSVLLLLCVLSPLQAQTYEQKRAFFTYVGDCIYEGDTIPFFQYRDLYVYKPLTFNNNKDWRNYQRLVYNVKKVYPLAVMINNTIIETYEYVNTLPENQRAAHLKAVERGMMDQFKPDFKKLSLSQGKLLIKMVDRQCSSPSYDIIRAFVGAARAQIYQGLACFFGASLKKNFSSKGEDKLTERIITLVQNDQL
ncbi:MAG: DUF4294 domain-containing protein [Bacteroidaceae bacterium]